MPKAVVLLESITLMVTVSNKLNLLQYYQAAKLPHIDVLRVSVNFILVLSFDYCVIFFRPKLSF